MSHPRTLVDAFRGSAAVRTNVQQKDFPIIYLEDGEETRETVADIYLGARQYLGALQRFGLKQGDYVVLQIPTRAKHFRTFWACALGGIIPVTVAVPLDFGETSAIVEKIRGVVDTLSGVKECLIISDDSVFEQLKDAIPSARVCSIDALSSAVVDFICAEAEVHPSDVLFLQLTSGSTGIPKCIQLTHEGIISQIEASAEVCGYAYGKTTLNWLPFDHVVPLLTCHLRDIYLGMGQVQIPTQDVLANPVLWLDSLEKYKVNFSWSPNFGYGIAAQACKRLRTKRTWDLSSIEFLMNAGEQVTQAVCDSFIDVVGIRANVIQPSFGMAESCTCITYCNNYSSKSIFRASKESLSATLVEVGADEPGVDFMDLGPVIDSVEIRIAGEDGVTVLPENVIGNLQIRGAVVTPGYVNRPSANREAFVGDGWFDSGDLGFLRNGRLYVTGRRQETINIRGTNLYCYEVEMQVASVAGILPSYVAATSVFSDAKGTEDLLVFFSPDDSLVDTSCLSLSTCLDQQMRLLVKNVQKRVTHATGIAPTYCIPVLSSNFHKTTSGKIQRNKFRSLFLEGHYDGFLSKIDRVPKLLQSNCFKHVWDLVETGEDPIMKTADLHLRVQLDGARINSPLEQKFERLFLKAGHSLVCENADAIVCLAALDAVSNSASEAASHAIKIIDQINRSFKKTDGTSRFWVLTSVSGYQKVVTSAVHGWMRSLAMERPDRKPSVLTVDCSIEANQNIPRVLTDSRFDVAREILLRQDEIFIATLRKENIVLAGTLTLSREASYLITGGTGALGLELARHLINMGARNIILFSRRGERELTTKTLEPMRKKGTRISVLSGDVGVQSDVEALVKILSNNSKPLKGVFHLAGVYESCKTCECSADFVEHVFRAKAKGAALLHESITRASLDLDHFVLFSSVASTIGPIGYAAYAAANSFLDGLADVLRESGDPALSIQWGPWNHVQGMAGNVEFEFLKKIEPHEGMTSLGFLMDVAAPTGLVLSDFNFSSYSFNLAEDEHFAIPHLLQKLVERTGGAQADARKPKMALSTEVLGELMGDILGFIPTPTDDLLSLGLDSAGIMRLIGSLKTNLQVQVPLNFVFKHPTVQAMTSYFQESLSGGHSDHGVEKNAVQRFDEVPLMTSAPDATASISQQSSTAKTMMKTLDFDTGVLGIPTSKMLNVSTLKDFKTVLEYARLEGVHLLCFSLNVGHPLEIVAEPHRVCTKVTYTTSTVAILNALREVTVRRDPALSVKTFGPKDRITADLVDLAVSTGTHSRFHIDPRLGREKMMAMFETWLRNSAKRVAADFMLVASVREDVGEKVIGYVTGKIKVGEADDTYGDVTLLACNPEFKNLSVNWHLLHSAIEWFSSKGINRVESSTHETNKSCQAMFEIAGMHVSGKSHDYHIWVQQYQF